MTMLIVWSVNIFDYNRSNEIDGIAVMESCCIIMLYIYIMYYLVINVL